MDMLSMHVAAHTTASDGLLGQSLVKLGPCCLLHVAAHTTASDGLLGQSLAKLVPCCNLS